MKSKLISLYNYASLINEPFSEEINIEDIMSDVENELHNLRYKCKELISSSIIQNEDIVTITLVSEKKKYNREHLKLNVGKKFFSKELEEFLIHKHVGETYCLVIDDVDVQVTIEECLHTHIPEISDELIKKQNIENIHTVEEYKNYILEKYKKLFHEYYVEYLAYMHAEEWFEKSIFEIDNNEEEKWYQAVKKIQDDELEFHNSTILENYPGEIEQENRKSANSYLKYTLIYCFLNGIDSLEFEPDLTNLTNLVEISKYVLKPLCNYISKYFTIIWKGEE